MAATSSDAIEVSLDDSNLSGENGEIYVFQWLTNNLKALQQASTEDLKASQDKLTGTLIAIITPSSFSLSPGRPIRSLVAQCLLAIYTRGETKSLFDTVQTFLKVAGDLKSPTIQDVHRVAAMYCSGEIMRVFGSQVMSLVTEITTLSLKLYKSSNSILLRYHAVIALNCTVYSAKRALTDALAKDVVKQMRQALGDKALPVVRAASQVLILMFPSGETSRTAVEIESLVTLCIKHLDAVDYPTRVALAKFAGHILASSQVERSIATSDGPKKNKKSDENDDDDVAIGPAHVVAEDMKPIMTPNEMFMQLSSHFNKPQTSQRTRIGLFSFYLSLLATLGSGFVERNYGLIADHFMTEIVSNSRNNSSRHEILLVRTLVGTVLRQLVGIRMLGEQAQIFAIQELSNAYLKRWPAMLPGQSAPAPLVLVTALREVSGLLQQLGNAPPLVQEALMDPLLTLLTHPNHTVRVHAAWALRCFGYSTPLRLPKALLTLVEAMQHDIAQLVNPAAPADIHLRALGHAYGLTSLLALIPHRPLYVSYDITANVFYTSVQLLKRAGDHDVHVAQVEVEIAWTTIAALMTLGPNFVKAHLPQLLVLWRNALPKPTTKDSTPGRSAAEWQFLLQVRENALRSVHQFLRHNAPLLTADISRRISSLLSNAVQLLNIFLSQRVEEVVDGVPVTKKHGLTLSATESLLRCRIFQCFSLLDPSSVTESTQMALLQATIALFASADGYSGSSVQAAIASSSGAFTNIWQSVDGYAYGVTDIRVDEEALSSASSDWLNRDSNEAIVDDLLRQPIIRSIEHDPLLLCEVQLEKPGHLESEAPNASTAAANAAIDLFARFLSVQDSSSVLRTITKLLEATESVKSEKNSGRKAASLMNATVALTLAFRFAQSQGRQSADIFGNTQISALLSSFLKGILVDGDVFLRRASSEAIGRLASLAGTNFLTNQIKTLVNEVVSNRDPYGRAGCALAFGAIYGYVGSLAAGPLLKTTVHVLMSLVNDPHPVVHYWALKSLSRVIDAASLAYASYVPSTLGLLFKIYMMDSHEPEGGSLNYANMSGDLPAYQAMCQTIDAVVTVVGPDIHESTRTRSLILDLVSQFLSEDDDDGICIEAIKCIQHALMFAPEQVEIPKLIARFRGYLSSTRRPLKVASINGLYQLVQKDALLMSRLGGDQLVEQLFGMLDYDSSVEGVRSVIMTWLQHTVVHNPSAWIDLCQRIMSRTTASQQIAESNIKRKDFLDDEGQSLSVDAGVDPDSDNSGKGRPVARWRTQLFALQCLHSICVIVAQSGRKEHVDLVFAREHGLPTSALLVSRVADLIKIAFTASAAQVMEIRLEGLTVLRDVLEIFAESPDPDYENAPLLEQYQAPIAAALTPAFSADSTPEILASAIEASAIFVGSGVVKDASRMGRILKLLVSALEQCRDSGMLRLGEAAELSPNASVMLRIATLAAWAKLKVACHSRSFLNDIVKPQIVHLAPLWISTLRDYSSAKAGSEAPDEGTGSGSLDISYSTLGREILLPYYTDSSPSVLNAVTVCMEEEDPSMQAALDGKQSIEGTTGVESHQTSPLFYVVFGLVYETLINSKPNTATPGSGRAVVPLRALKCLVRPHFAGDVFQDPAIFEELVHLLYRLALTETVIAQVHLLEAVMALCRSLHSRTPSLNGASDTAAVATTHCLKIVAYVLKRLLPGSYDHAQLDDKLLLEHIKALNTGFSAFCEIMKHCGPTQQYQFQILGLYLYHELLRDESTTRDLVGPTLQSLKLLLNNSAKINAQPFESLVHSVLSGCLMNIDSMRGRAGPACSRKISNNLLAISLIMTVIPPEVQIGQAVVDHCCFLICQNLALVNEDSSLTAAHCARTLIVAALSGNVILHLTVKLLLPGIVDSVSAIAVAAEGDKEIQHHTLIVAELWKTLGYLCAHTPQSLRANILGVVLPCMILLLNPTKPLIHHATVSQVLSFATSDPEAFKEVVSKLHPDMSKLMEDSIKQVLATKKVGTVDTHVKPQISLRSFK